MSRPGTRRWDAADHLDTTEDMVTYLEAALEQDASNSLPPCSATSPEHIRVPPRRWRP